MTFDQGGKQIADVRQKTEGVKEFRSFSVVAMSILGALATAGIATALLVPGLIGPTVSNTPTLSGLAHKDIDAALPTLDPGTSRQAVADAKSCKVPLAWVTLVKATGSGQGAVRIRSGSYLSPMFEVTDVAQRVAVPYPAPYQTGQGVISVVGNAKGISVYLTPGWSNQDLDGLATINVRWMPINPC